MLLFIAHSLLQPFELLITIFVQEMKVEWVSKGLQERAPYKAAGGCFSGLAGNCFNFSFQITSTFREVFSLRGFVIILFSIEEYLFHSSLQSMNF